MRGLGPRFRLVCTASECVALGKGDGVYEALQQLIPWWKRHGWRVVTVGTMLGGRKTGG